MPQNRDWNQPNTLDELLLDRVDELLLERLELLLLDRLLDELLDRDEDEELDRVLLEELDWLLSSAIWVDESLDSSGPTPPAGCGLGFGFAGFFLAIGHSADSAQSGHIRRPAPTA